MPKSSKRKVVQLTPFPSAKGILNIAESGTANEVCPPSSQTKLEAFFKEMKKPDFQPVKCKDSNFKECLAQIEHYRSIQLPAGSLEANMVPQIMIRRVEKKRKQQLAR